MEKSSMKQVKNGYKKEKIYPLETHLSRNADCFPVFEA